MKIKLLVIDPQNDFCDGPSNGKLAVPGAYDDMTRLAAMVRRLAPKLDDIFITLDSHRLIDIAHPIWWMDANGKSPNPFTIIGSADLDAGIWTTRNPAFRSRSLAYVKQLEAQGNYPLCIWPPHCLIGSKGHTIHDELLAAVQTWEGDQFAQAQYVTKGSNPWTEHYSAIQAEVPDPNDPSTSLNTQLITEVADADLVPFAGEAGSHCVPSTLRDIFRNIDPAMISKFVLMMDAVSPVPGFEAAQQAFIDEYVQKGMKLSTTVDFMK